MTIGTSGRIVIEIEPELKQELHSTLREEGTNLKSWFLDNVDQFLTKKEPFKPRLDESRHGDPSDEI